MITDSKKLHEFGNCRLDSDKKVLWCEDKPVALPLKAVELLSVLVERSGEVVTKDEIWRAVWQDAFVEETNLTHNIYLLRRTLKDLGEPDLIQTVPRRGYRFAGEVRQPANGDLVIEKHSITRTLVEEIPVPSDALTTTEHRFFSLSRGRVAIAVAAIVLVASGFAIWNKFADTAATESTRMRSLAVLPLTSLTGTDDDKALNVGFADSLITRLGKINDIRIISSRTTSRYTGVPREAVDIGRELGVDGVLEGTLQRSNEKLRVTLRLIRTSDGAQVWSGLISDAETEIFRMQDALAFQAAQALSRQLPQKEDAKRPTDNLEAYHLFLKGDYLFRLRGEQNTTMSARFFREAVRLDPDYARAWAGLAAVLAMGTDIPSAESALEKALALDPQLAEAHATRGFIRMFHYWDWPAAEKSLTSAVELDPNSVQAHHWRGVYFSFHGRFDEAKAEMERALELDPVSLNLNSDLGQLYYLARDHERSIEYCERALAIDPEYSMAHTYLSRTYRALGRNDRAFEHATRGTCPGFQDEEGRLTCKEKYREAYARGGWQALVEMNVSIIRRELSSGRTPANKLSNHYHALALNALEAGDKAQALEYLDRSTKVKVAYEIMNFSFPYLKVDPQFDALRDEPRFREILRKINLL